MNRKVIPSATIVEFENRNEENISPQYHNNPSKNRNDSTRFDCIAKNKHPTKSQETQNTSRASHYFHQRKFNDNKSIFTLT